MQLATLGNRFLSHIIDAVIDALIISAVVACTLIPSGMIGSAIDGSSNKGGVGGLLVSCVLCVVFLLAIGYYVLRYAYLPNKNNGQTWGQKAANVRMVTLEGHHIPSVGKLAIRVLVLHLLGIINLAGFLINEQNKQGIHDLAAGTIVVPA